jgi:hypothetical protein
MGVGEVEGGRWEVFGRMSFEEANFGFFLV